MTFFLKKPKKKQTTYFVADAFIGWIFRKLFLTFEDFRAGCIGRLFGLSSSSCKQIINNKLCVFLLWLIWNKP